MAERIATATEIESFDLIVEGSDGVGQKTELPWVRYGSRSRSPSATEGWYCVFLFSTDGASCYLSLAHGSTVWNGSSFVPRSHSELRQLAAWGRKVVHGSISGRDDLTPTMSLKARRTNLGPAYEAGTVICRRYEPDSIPSNDQLASDVVFFGKLLGELYRREEVEPIPIGVAPEIVQALEDADQAAGKVRSPRFGRQGIRFNAKQRKAIEERAMKLAEEYLVELGWNVRNTSSNKPYDYYCSSLEEELYVEVKGTTSSGASILLTRGEVEHHRSVYPSNALIVVSEIELIGPDFESAQGGQLRILSPWDINDERLKVVSFIYDL